MADKYVVKHSGAIQIENKICLMSRKIWNVLLYNAYKGSRDEGCVLLDPSTRYEIGVNELKEMLGVTSNDLSRIRNSLTELIGTPVSWNVLNKHDKTWTATALLASAAAKRGAIEYSYSSHLCEFLSDPDMYARINLSLQCKFRCKHSLALYELCLDYYDRDRRGGVTPKIPLDNFRLLMGIERGQYLLFKNLRKSVINKAICEVNKKSDINVGVEFFKVGRCVSMIQFLSEAKEGVCPKFVPEKRSKNKGGYREIGEWVDVEGVDVGWG